MNDQDFPITVRQWPLQEKDITGELCQRCGLCCEMTISAPDDDSRQLEFFMTVVENYPNITISSEGDIRIRCSHLRETKSGWKSMECDIYDTRPQLCQDFNCVSWAKVSNDLTLYNQVLEKVVEIGKEKVSLTRFPEFNEELRGPDA